MDNAPDHLENGAYNSNALLPKQLFQLPLPFILKELVEMNRLVVNRFALVYLWWEERTFVSISSRKIPTNMHMEENRDPLISTFG